MKQLEKKAIEQLLSIIPNHPAQRIMQISSGGKELTDNILELVKKEDYEFLLTITDENFYNSIKEKYDNESHCSVKLIKFENRRYVSMAKMYDYIFVTAEVPNESSNEFSKKIHSHIKNAGNLILFLPKNDLKTLDSWREILTENLFVAINNIDMFKNYEILIAKKMHGWGS